MSDAQTRGSRETLRALDLDALAGRPIEEIFVGLIDFICPSAGTVDDGIARSAFIDTIADLASLGITDLDALSADQLRMVFELYATHAIETRLCNDIGMKLVTFPADTAAIERVQAQLTDFVRRSVSDAVTSLVGTAQATTPDQVLQYVNEVYRAAFEILQALGDAELGP